MQEDILGVWRKIAQGLSVPCAVIPVLQVGGAYYGEVGRDRGETSAFGHVFCLKIVELPGRLERVACRDGVGIREGTCRVHPPARAVLGQNDLCEAWRLAELREGEALRSGGVAGCCFRLAGWDAALFGGVWKRGGQADKPDGLGLRNRRPGRSGRGGLSV
ncbi:hypothetical protein AD952_12425 [Acetobacter cerevisiae]|uniref:Uncharacterized protein n=1 Tax=Acetobacter cerevisiae TaxID=178900 RepID=A0A149URT4_9PROT|nr:hypothetical protein AD952_12425 [Acetobacter cerevisiae]